MKNDTDIAEKNLDHLRDVYSFEVQRAGFERDARLRQLDGVDAQTIQQKMAVEQQQGGYRDRLSGEGPRGEAEALRHGHPPHPAWRRS